MTVRIFLLFYPFVFKTFSSPVVRDFLMVYWFCLQQENIVTEYLNNKNIEDAVNGVKEMKAPKHFLPEMLSKIILCSLERTDEDREQASTLIHTLHTEGFITGENFMQVSYLAPPPPFRNQSLYLVFQYLIPIIWFLSSGSAECLGSVS